MEKINFQSRLNEDFMPSLLGYLGLLPFIIPSLAISVPEYQPISHDILKIYGSIILTFIGAVHWGVTFTTSNVEQSGRQLLFSITPALISLIVLLAAHDTSLLVLAICFAVFWGLERSIFSHLLPGWYVKLRDRLSICVIGALLFSYIVIYISA